MSPQWHTPSDILGTSEPRDKDCYVFFRTQPQPRDEKIPMVCVMVRPRRSGYISENTFCLVNYDDEVGLLVRYYTANYVAGHTVLH